MRIALLSVFLILFTLSRASLLKPSADQDVVEVIENFRHGWNSLLTTFIYNQTYPLNETCFGSPFELVLQKMKDIALDRSMSEQVKLKLLIQNLQKMLDLFELTWERHLITDKIDEQCKNEGCSEIRVIVRIITRLFKFIELVYDFEHYLNTKWQTHEERLHALRKMGFDAAEIVHILVGMETI